MDTWSTHDMRNKNGKTAHHGISALLQSRVQRGVARHASVRVALVFCAAVIVGVMMDASTATAATDTPSKAIPIKEQGDYFWNTVKDSNSAEQYELYIFAYPQGRFRLEAEKRAKTLHAAEAKSQAEKWVVTEMEAAPFQVSRATGLRKTPEPTGKVVRTLDVGEPVEVTGKVVDTVWYQVKVADGAVGFVAEEFIAPESTVATVPDKTPVRVIDSQPIAAAPAVSDHTPKQNTNPEAKSRVVPMDTKSAVADTAAKAPVVETKTAVADVQGTTDGNSAAAIPVGKAKETVQPLGETNVDTASVSPSPTASESEAKTKEVVAAQPAEKNPASSAPAASLAKRSVAEPEKTEEAATAKAMPKAVGQAISKPSPAAALSERDAKRLETLLRQVTRDIKADRLTLPSRNNAFARLREAGTLAPNDPRVAQGLRNIVNRYVELIREAAGAKQTARVNEHLERAERVMPGSAIIEALRKEVNAN
jgi:hypothetical protein